MAGSDIFETIVVGMIIGKSDLILNRNTVDNYINLVQWGKAELVDKLGFAPPGMTIDQHPIMEFGMLPGSKAAIWAKSEHQFYKPLKLGSKISISGKVIDKYTKRGKNYIVAEFETRDDMGDLLLRSQETGILIELEK